MVSIVQVAIVLVIVKIKNKRKRKKKNQTIKMTPLAMITVVDKMVHATAMTHVRKTMIVARIIMTSVQIQTEVINTNMFRQSKGVLVELNGNTTDKNTQTVETAVSVL